jgi:hypothetical protein
MMHADLTRADRIKRFAQYFYAFGSLALMEDRGGADWLSESLND